MRNFKFRFQSKHDNKMHYSDECGSLESFWSDVEVDSVKGTLGQYTGLTDCNDNPIYEGDIVQCTHWFFDGNEVEENFVANVGFRDGSFTLENINSRYYSNYTGEENGKGVCWIGSINYYEEDYEVIGNIYENQELLNTAE